MVMAAIDPFRWKGEKRKATPAGGERKEREKGGSAPIEKVEEDEGRQPSLQGGRGLCGWRKREGVNVEDGTAYDH